MGLERTIHHQSSGAWEFSQLAGEEHGSRRSHNIIAFAFFQPLDATSVTGHTIFRNSCYCLNVLFSALNSMSTKQLDLQTDDGSSCASPHFPSLMLLFCAIHCIYTPSIHPMLPTTMTRKSCAEQRTYGLDHPGPPTSGSTAQNS